MTRRDAVFISALSTAAGAPGRSHRLTLPKPRAAFSVDLMTALRLRRSTRSFLRREITTGDLSSLLWSADGVNRADGRRTAPFWLAMAGAGHVGQNIYMAAAALGLATVWVGHIHRGRIAEELALGNDRVALAVMPVGHPRRPQ